MAKPIALPEREDVFAFDHAASRVNYGGQRQFHQAAFPAESRPEDDFEHQLFTVITRYADMLLTPGPKATPNIAGKSSVWADLYLDHWGEVSRLSMAAFMRWVQGPLEQFAALVLRLRVNALTQERASGVARMNYFVQAACATRMAEMISDFFSKNLARFGTLAASSRFHLAHCLSVRLEMVEDSAEIKHAIQEKFSQAGSETAVIGGKRIWNPFIIGYDDAADVAAVLEVLQHPNPYRISSATYKAMVKALTAAISKQKNLGEPDITRVLAEPVALEQLWAIKSLRRRLIGFICRSRPVWAGMVTENAGVALLQRFRDFFRDGQGLSELAQAATHLRESQELLEKPALRKNLIKALRREKKTEARELLHFFRLQTKHVRKAKGFWWWGLHMRQIEAEVLAALRRFYHFNAAFLDFQLFRSHYGQNSRLSLPWQGLRIWQAYEIISATDSHTGLESTCAASVWEKKKADIENAFSEGSLFLIRPEGALYATGESRRQMVCFLFADLRNSTETTMKLNKDTASYLAPYLTAVNSSALQHRGSRIYFAGDGYAAHFTRATEGIRAAYPIFIRFGKIRAEASELHAQKAREILRAAIRLGFNPKKPQKNQELYEGLRDDARQGAVAEFLGEIVKHQESLLTEMGIKKILSKVAEAYSMPIIEGGVALTSGELFQAMVGEPAEEKIPIVISPQLTQAARLSGSADSVKQYVESHFPHPAPYHVFAWENKLYNRGIVATETVIDELSREVELATVTPTQQGLQNWGIRRYFDQKIKRHVIIRENTETVLLKGIREPVKVFEIALPNSPLDRELGS